MMPAKKQANNNAVPVMLKSATCAASGIFNGIFGFLYKCFRCRFCNNSRARTHKHKLVTPQDSRHMASASLRMPGGDVVAPGSIGNRALMPLLPYMGPPQRAPQLNPGDRQRFESFSLMDIFSGRSEYLQNGVSALIKSSYNNYMTTYILPLERHDDMNFVVRKIDFKRTLAPQTGPQAPFTVVQAGVSSQSFTLNRYALGITASAESLKTDEGQAVLEGGLINIATAFADTMEQAGFLELIGRRQHYRVQARMNGVRAAPGEDPFAEEKAFFDCVRKSSRGAFAMLDRVRGYMKEIIPTDMIVPEGLRSLVAADPAESEYFRAGPDARRNAIMGGDAQQPNIEGGLRTHVARGFTLDDGAVVVDPLGHDVTIGDHFRLEDYTTCVPAAEYNSCHRRIYVFDMSVANGGDFGAVDLMYALRHSERFNNDKDGTLRAEHYELAANVGDELRARGIEVARDQVIDPFLHRLDDDTYRVCRVIGHQEPGALAYEDIRAVAETLLYRQAQGLKATDGDDIKAGLDLIARLNGTGVAGDANAGIRNALNALSVVDRPTGAPAYVSATRGAGYGSPAGLRAIARSGSKDFGDVPERFSAAIERLFDATRALVVPSHPCLDASYVPYGFEATGPDKERQDRITTFAHNLLSGNLPALFKRGGAAGGGVWEPYPADNEIAGGREVLSVSSPTGIVRATFATAEDTKAFAAKFAESQFARDYAAAKRGKRARRQVRSFEDGDGSSEATTLGAFMIAEITTKPVGSVAVMAAVIDVVNRGESIDNVDDWLAGWRTITSFGDQERANLNVTATGLSLDYSVAKGLGDGWLISNPLNGGDLLAVAEVVEKRGDAAKKDIAQHTVFSRAFAVSGAHAGDVGEKRGRAEYQERFAGKPQPTVFDPYMREAESDGRMHLTQPLVGRWARAYDEERDPLRRAAIHLVLLAPICLRTYELWDANHVRVPISVLGERPLRVYHTAAVIVLRGGHDLGITAYNGVDAQLGANMVNKTFSVHISLWFAPIIVNEENYFLVDNALVNGYGGGENLQAHTLGSFDINNNADERSVFFFAVPYGSLRGQQQVPRTHDLRGRFADDVIEGRLSRAAAQSAKRLQWAGALYYDRLYRFSTWNTPRLEDQDYFRRGFSGRQENTVTHQTMQYVWDPQKKQHSRYIMNTDHFGPNIYPGHGYLRAGSWTERYKDMHYEQTYVPFD